MIIAYFALLRERTVPNYAVPVQACPRMHDSQRAGTAPPQTETLRQTLSTGSVPNSGGHFLFCQKRKQTSLKRLIRRENRGSATGVDKED